MKRTSVFLTIFALLIYVSSAHAYLDPGSGSMVLQVILGGIAGLLLAIKIFWHRILQAFGIKTAEKKEEPK